MKCPKCQFENRDGVRFCEECGASFELECPACKTKIPPRSKFCGRCGHNLVLPSARRELSFDEKLKKIQKYLPKGITEKILSQRDRMEGERKQVTVMFCDMEGFTSLSEKLGPEEMYTLMDHVYEILIHKVHDYEGTVNEMTGDGVMALFGAPIALEDAPQRAMRSAMAIHREMTNFNERMKQEKRHLPPIKMRVGIHTGPVVVGTLGNDLRVEFKAVGDTVNLASRMESLAEPGTTYVSEDTFKLTEGFFRFEALGERIVKGKEEPVKVYQVIAPSTRRTRFDVSAERGLTPFFGRERELDLLLDAFARSKMGRGQAFSIVSEAGVGKSRLLYEFRKAVTNEDITFLEGKCLSYSQHVAFHPVIDILKSNFYIRENDGDSEIREKVQRGLKVLQADEAATSPYLLELLSVEDSGINRIPMSPESRKDRIIEALKLIVLKGSEIRPLIMAIEDLHWIDKSSEETLKYLLESISGVRVLLIFTHRPEFPHTWGGRSYHSQVNLNRLSNRESLSMATHILGTEDIEGDLEELILEKTEGIPFFVEEFVKSLKDIKAIEKSNNRYHLIRDIHELSIPSTIQDVIMARVDSLPEAAKELLQKGSVIEREFSYELIRRMTGLPERELLSHLSVLKDSELLYERGIFPQSTYIFKHALTQEVVNNSILSKAKKRLHEQIGNVIEELYKDSLDEHYGILTEHFIASDNYEKGIKYSKLAGKKATLTGSAEGAIDYAKKTVAALERLPRTEDVQREIIDLRTVLGAKLADLNYFQEAKLAIDPVIDIAIKKGYKKRISQMLTIIGGREYCVEENFSKAFEHLEMALKIAEELGDTPSLGLTSYWLGYARSLNAEFEKAARHMEKTLDISILGKDIVRIAMMKSILSWQTYFVQGKIDAAYQTSHEALQVAKESGDIYSNSFACGSHGISCFGKGFLKEAKAHFLKGVGLSEKINQYFWNSTDNHFLGEIYFEVGDYKKAQDHYEKSIHLMERLEWLPSWRNLNKIALARVKVMCNEGDIELESLYAYVSENRVKQFEGCMLRYLGEILLNMDDQHILEAEVWIKKAIESDKRNTMVWHFAIDHVVYSEVLKRKGNRIKAKETLGRGIEILKECGADGWVEKYEKELAKLT